MAAQSGAHTGAVESFVLTPLCFHVGALAECEINQIGGRDNNALHLTMQLWLYDKTNGRAVGMRGSQCATSSPQPVLVGTLSCNQQANWKFKFSWPRSSLGSRTRRVIRWCDKYAVLSSLHMTAGLLMVQMRCREYRRHLVRALRGITLQLHKLHRIDPCALGPYILLACCFRWQGGLKFFNFMLCYRGFLEDACSSFTVGSGDLGS